MRSASCCSACPMPANHRCWRALAQAAQSQQELFHGKLIDKSHGLLELQKRLYEDRPRETLEELTAFPVAVEPLPTNAEDAAESPKPCCMIATGAPPTNCCRAGTRSPASWPKRPLAKRSCCGRHADPGRGRGGGSGQAQARFWPVCPISCGCWSSTAADVWRSAVCRSTWC